MKSTAMQIVKRVELALDQATLGHEALAWQLELAELTLWIHSGEGMSQARVLVQGEALPKRGVAQKPVVDHPGKYERVFAPMKAPFRGSATDREWERSRRLSRMLEVALESVNTLESEGGAWLVPRVELGFSLIVHRDGEVMVVTTEQQALGNKWHRLRVHFTEMQADKESGR